VSQSRKHLSAKGLLELVREEFNKINPRVLSKRTSKPISLVDCLMSGLAIFSLKFPSLLQFEEQSKKAGLIKKNLGNLYQIKQVPSDTYLRERLDEVNPRLLRKAFKTIFAQVQRGKVLEDYTYLDGHYMLPMDMTGFFSSSNIHCENCCIKQHNRAKLKLVNAEPTCGKDFKSDTYILFKDDYISWRLFYNSPQYELLEIKMSALLELKMYLIGLTRRQLKSTHLEEIKKILEKYHEEKRGSSLTYYHNMMCAAIVHPDLKIVLPFAPEPVLKGDGATKNDCEQNAVKRLIADIRREHPHLKLIAVQDALGATSSNLLELKFANIRFIVGAKPDNHKDLFSLVKQTECHTHQHVTEDGKTHRYRYINQVPLNRTGFEVNFLEYWEIDKNGGVKHFSWVTDIEITNENVYQIMRGGRTNWRLENNTFNTLKNQGYHFSHNFGHGYQHLCSVFGMLMMLAFFIDQVQEYCCEIFKNARKKFRTRTALWQKMRGLFLSFVITSWEDLFNAIAHGYQEIDLIPNTS
jgi:hypothetical protein